MDLPIHRRERREIVRALDPHPWQAIAAVYLPGLAAAQGTVTIIQHDLRDGPEHKFANRVKCRGHRYQHRRDARPQDIGDLSLGGCETDYTIGGRDQPPRKADPLGLIRVEQVVARAAGDNRCKLPGKINGVADPGIHALSAGRAVDVRRVAEQEYSPFTEMFRYQVMHVIGRKPVDLLDVDLEVADRPVADVFKRQRIGTAGTLVAYRSDQARLSLSGQRKDAQEIGLVEVDVQFAIQRGAGGFDIGDVKELSIGAAGKSGADRLAHDRAD